MALKYHHLTDAEITALGGLRWHQLKKTEYTPSSQDKAIFDRLMPHRMVERKAGKWVLTPYGELRWAAAGLQLDMEGAARARDKEEYDDLEARWEEVSEELEAMEKKMKAANPRKGARQFFYTNAGYSYDPKTETKEQGRKRTAQALADAEQWAWDNNYDFEWEQEIEDWSTFLDGTEIDADEVSDIVSVVMRNVDGEGVQALGGIIEGYDSEDVRNYRRVVEAELAWEEMTEIQQGKPTPASTYQSNPTDTKKLKTRLLR